MWGIGGAGGTTRLTSAELAVGAQHGVPQGKVAQCRVRLEGGNDAHEQQHRK